MAKKTIKGRNKSRAQQPLPDDWHLWTQVTRSVSPLRRIRPVSAAGDNGDRPQLPAPTRQENAQTRTCPSWSPGSSSNHGFARHQVPREPIPPSMDRRTTRRVRRGQTSIDATIDLHGLRQDEARSALFRFIETRLHRGDRTVLIITGKGMKTNHCGNLERRGVLRQMLPRWLTDPALAPHVAGFETSAPHHGGEGAFYVRLKRLRPKRPCP